MSPAPTPPEERALPFVPYLGGVALVALIVRVLYLFQLHDTLPLSTLILDGRVFDAWAQTIAAGDWLGTEVFYQAPLYPYFLATLYAVIGRDLFIVRVMQALLSVSSCVFLAWAGRCFLGARAGFVAGLLLAVFAPAIFFDSLIQKAALDLWFITLLLALLGELQRAKTSTAKDGKSAPLSPEAVDKLRPTLGHPGEGRDPVPEWPADAHIPSLDPGLRRGDVQTKTRPQSKSTGVGEALAVRVPQTAARQRQSLLIAVAGVVLGLFTLSRENALLLYPLLAAWVWLQTRLDSTRERWKGVVVLTLGTALVLLPVVWRNYYVGGELVVTTSFGPNFYIGNHAGAQGRYEPLVANRADPRFERIDAKRLAEEAVGRPLSMSAASYYWLTRAFADIRAQPLSWLRLMAWKVALVFNATELEDGEGIEVYAEYSSLLRGLNRIFNLGVILPLAVLGLWLTRSDWRRLWILYAILVALAGSTALFFVFARYRFTFVPIVVLFAGAAVDLAIQATKQPGHRRTWAPGFLLALLTAVFCNYRLPIAPQAAVTYVNLGMGLLADGRPAEALVPLRRAIEIKPTMAGAYQNLGGALSALGRHDEAAKQYEKALQYAPDFGMAHAALGQHYLAKNLPDQALPHLTRAVDLVPEMPSLGAQLAEVLNARGDAAVAVTQLRRCWHGTIESWFCANNLATLLATHRDPQIRNGQEAVTLAEKLAALALPPQSALLTAADQATILDTLAAAYAEVGRYDDAIYSAQRALAAARSASNPGLLEVLESRLRLYQSQQPYHGTGE